MASHQQSAQGTQRGEQHRDLMFCHQCENEWYRDEHGLVCPDCNGEFTQIIEENDDPRDDDGPPGLVGGPFLHHVQQAMNPPGGQDDRGRGRWRDNDGPGFNGGDVFRTFYFNGPQVGQASQQQGQNQQQNQGQGQTQGHPAGTFMGAIGSLLHNYLSPPSPPQQQHQQQQNDQRDRAHSAPGTPRENEPRVRIFNFPGGSMTITSMTYDGPRNANAPQPFNRQPEPLEQIMAQMVANIGTFGGGHPAVGSIMPFGLFDAIVRGGGGVGSDGRIGDAVFTQEALDRVITQLMEQNQSGHAPGPASAAAISSLPQRPVTAADGDEKTGIVECSICMDQIPIGNSVTVLPCSHWFHKECITAWLSEHDTCPHCRQGIMPKEDQQRSRDATEPPLNDTHGPDYRGPRPVPTRQVSNGERRATSAEPATRRDNSSFLGRMRDAFNNNR
ncbi:hypothetical protein K470DRAFT_256792 [Piedraia hortae CBS 480.64]|uniref:RING-type domain-containing protein n=1 Tax=Piedraia hortae CBS 480.64 TaxID=1314780 RepID=A0A6A7C2R9_9PEZI|nr:hypothetical protein K470DRAFT_256792 [Piedraia hortae CBS 480.64]